VVGGPGFEPGASRSRIRRAPVQTPIFRPIELGISKPFARSGPFPGLLGAEYYMKYYIFCLID